MRIFRFRSVDSTNERALAEVASGTALDGDVFVAEEQTAGRGRRKRVWTSEPAQGLYLSYVHVPEVPGPPAEALTMAAGLCVHEAVRELGVRDARLEWPNDVMVGEAKLAGILIETRWGSGEGAGPAQVPYVIGIGLNVLWEAIPPELAAERRVTSMRLCGSGASVPACETAVLERLPGWLERARSAAAALYAEYARVAGIEHADLRVETAEREVRGRLTGLDTEHGVRLLTPEGRCVDLPLAHVRALEPLG